MRSRPATERAARPTSPRVSKNSAAISLSSTPQSSDDRARGASLKGETMSILDKKQRTGTRKLLALDGGGIRGVMTLEVLDRIQSELQKKLGRGDDFVLADYFDYVAGT